jgi:DNA (cytosine-5)-methyltransferase 1
MIKPKNRVIDLFSGCGGLSYGFIEAGYDVVLGIDHWKDAITTFENSHKNSKGLVADLFIETPKQISKKTGVTNIDLIIGGPPCQGFSIAGKRIINDERNKLYKSFVSFVEFYKPKAFLMENVPNIVSMGQGVVKDSIIKDFEKLGYKVVYKVLMASEYGVPQNRKRAFFVGTKKNEEFVFPSPNYKELVSAKDAISDLPEKSINDGAKYSIIPKSEYQEQIRKGSNGIFNHEITNHSEQTIEIISMVPDGGNYKNLPLGLQKTRNVNIAWTRLNSKKPSFTIDTGHRHHFHYKYNRIPTVRESARIQSFPDSFIFLGSKTSQYKQVGNAVPPILAKVLAESLKKYL